MSSGSRVRELPWDRELKCERGSTYVLETDCLIKEEICTLFCLDQD